MYFSLSIYIYIYIYIYSEREREIERNKKRKKENQDGERESEQAGIIELSIPHPSRLETPPSRPLALKEELHLNRSACARLKNSFSIYNAVCYLDNDLDDDHMLNNCSWCRILLRPLDRTQGYLDRAKGEG